MAENAIGWNGLLAEIGEETLNQPISSLIMGREWNEAFLDVNGDFDPSFFQEMAGAMGVTQMIFGGGNYVRIRRNMKKNKN